MPNKKSKNTGKLNEVCIQLKGALKFYQNSSTDHYIKLLSVTKAFEVAVETAWKELKRRCEEKGLEALSPKDAVRQAARIGLVKQPLLWIEMINARNVSSHDYAGISEAAYVRLSLELLKEFKRVFKIP